MSFRIATTEDIQPLGRVVGVGALGGLIKSLRAASLYYAR
jgi:hypothetical protein